MKKVVIVIFILSSTILFAQREKRHQNPKTEAKEFYASLSAEDLATLKTKQLVLSLNLNDVQFEEVYTLTLNKIKDDRKKREQQKSEDKKNLTTEERYDRSIERLDEQIAYSRQMQSILNQDQFEKWQHISKRHNAIKRRNHRRSR